MIGNKWWSKFTDRGNEWVSGMAKQLQSTFAILVRLDHHHCIHHCFLHPMWIAAVIRPFLMTKSCDMLCVGHSVEGTTCPNCPDSKALDCTYAHLGHI